MITNIAKFAASLTNLAHNALSFLLQETGSYLLLESGDRIVISGPQLTNVLKNQ